MTAVFPFAANLFNYKIAQDRNVFEMGAFSENRSLPADMCISFQS